MDNPAPSPTPESPGVVPPVGQSPTPTPTPSPVPTPSPEPTPAPKPEVPVPTPSPAPEDKNPNKIPPKFLKEDGSPDYAKLADAHVNLEKLLGKKNFSNVNTPTEYDYKPVEGAKPIEAKNMEAFQKKAFDAGLTKEQFALVMNEYVSLTKTEAPKDTPFTLPDAKNPDAVAKVRKTLESVWGVGNEAFEAGRLNALKTVNTYLPSQFKISDPVFNHPAVLALLANVGNELGEGSLTRQGSPTGGGPSGLRTPEQIRALPDFKANPQKYDAEMMKYYEAQPGGKTLVGSRNIR